MQRNVSTEFYDSDYPLRTLGTIMEGTGYHPDKVSVVRRFHVITNSRTDAERMKQTILSICSDNRPLTSSTHAAPT